MRKADIGAARLQMLALVNAQGESVGGSFELYLPAKWVQAVAGNALLYLSDAKHLTAEVERVVDECIAQLKQNLARIRERSSEGAPES